MTDSAERITYDAALRIVRTTMSAANCGIEVALNNPLIPEDLKPDIRETIRNEESIVIRDPSMVMDSSRRTRNWLSKVDRAGWYYWPRLREHLIDNIGWPEATVRSIDDATDRILGAMDNPASPNYDIRGLVVGYVQSGKTANYSALIAKAADTGYKLVIVLSGVHNSLRLQTQRRLTKELVGMENGQSVGVGRPREDREWHTFTASHLNGDFDPGNANATALTGTNPVLIVTKKNSQVLERLNSWLDSAHENTLRQISCLVIDDEADQASINTGGNRVLAEEIPDIDSSDLDQMESPSRINDQVRNLITKFPKVTYVGYTATPFANVLIDHRAVDNLVGSDLYPRDFIVSLPRPHGYYGASNIFGGMYDDEETNLDVIRPVDYEDADCLVPRHRADVESFEPTIPSSLENALIDYILAGSARSLRGQGIEPTTMLIHTTYSKVVQRRIKDLIEHRVAQLRDEWRYMRGSKMVNLLRERWEDFRRVTRSEHEEMDVPFDKIESHVGLFLEKLVVLLLNSDTDDELEYERDQDLKCVVIGGNRLSRGMTLEGLLVSYFVRRSLAYDTLMQMGRWFGFRDGYVDLTRIYTTDELRLWFRELATVEDELRDEIAQYEREDLTPSEVGVRIRQHSSLLVTSPLKMGEASRIHISFSDTLRQTINFPFQDRNWLMRNIEVSRGFFAALGEPTESHGPCRPIWKGIDGQVILDFLSEYQMDASATQVRPGPILDYIEKQLEYGELTSWLVGILGLKSLNPRLGTINLEVHGVPSINLIERTKLERLNSFKTITSTASDQMIGLTDEQKSDARLIADNAGISISRALRHVRDKGEGVLLFYPISRNSGHDIILSNGRTPIFSNPQEGEHIIGIALIFPYSENRVTVEYVIGSVSPRVEL